MMQIPCKGRGLVIYPHGEGLLAAQCDHRPFIAKRLDALGLRRIQDGDHETTFIFPVERFEEVAAVVKPRKRRVMSQERKEVLRARLTAFAFAKSPQPTAKNAS
jgi:hypothetical protein